jgi:predicted dehydrogenase
MSGNGFSRRDVLRTGGVAAATILLPNGVFAQGKEQLKVGVIGCGGRGTDAMVNCAEAESSVVLWAMADVFRDKLDSSAATLKDRLKDRFQVTADRTFMGFDAYEKLLQTGVDVVILTSPPGFRPAHIKASVAAGKHIFTEKPIAVDGPGVRTVIEAANAAKAKGLAIVAGTQRRHDVAYREAMARIHDGAMGDVVACYAYWNQGGLWMHPRKEGWSDMEWQLRNWLYFTWLSGDHIVEQHVHNLDVCNWAMKGHPVKAVCLGGREVRTDAAYGHIFDHFATEYEYANGVKMLSMCRQIDGTASRVSEHLVGTRGTSNGNTWIRGESAWRWDGDRPNPYMLEHRNLFASIRDGNPINEGVQVAESTMTAIMGRMSAYTGQEVTWDQAMASQESLVPEKLEMGAKLEVPPIAVPGKTKLI